MIPSYHPQLSTNPRTFYATRGPEGDTISFGHYEKSG
jgi:hypothetical protein